MADINPLHSTHPSSSAPPSLSKKVFTISGLLTTVYGLDELQESITDVACLWLLHPRLQTQECMQPIAADTITEWNNRLRQGRAGKNPKGLIAVSFDQRNHGSREVDKLANAAWREGNPRHAQDMFSIYHGTSADTSNLLTHLPSYAFPDGKHALASHLVLGVSLGGHAVWHCVLHDPRITTGIAIIGCPDYTRLMVHRAEKSRLKTWTDTTPPGSRFLGSTDFPKGLVDAVAKWDPAGLMMHNIVKDPHAPTDAETARFIEVLNKHLAGKQILNLSGGVDKLVPYSTGEPFLQLLKRAVNSADRISFEDVIYDGIGHKMSPEMAQKAVDYVCDALTTGDSPSSGIKEYKI